MTAPDQQQQQPRWYCVRTGSKQEARVANQIRAEQLGEAYCPRVRFRKSRRGGAVWVVEALFPTYVFARFEFAASWRKILALNGVKGFVRFGGDPAALSDAMVAELQSSARDETPIELDQSVHPGTEVEIVGGPFRGLRAVVARLLPAKERVAILLEVLGMEREVEIAAGHVLADLPPPLPRG